MNIFLLEDDDAIGIGLTYSLENEGYKVTLAKTVREAIKTISENDFSLYILDLTLPDGNGYDVCKRIKEKGDLPVIFLTAYDDEINVVMGFDLGADDYIAKPFRVKELLVRIKSVLRRYHKDSADGVFRIKNMTVNTNEAKVYAQIFPLFLDDSKFSVLSSVYPEGYTTSMMVQGINPETVGAANPKAQAVISIIALVANVCILAAIIKRSVEQKKNPYKNEIFTDQKNYKDALLRAAEANREIA